MAATAVGPSKSERCNLCMSRSLMQVRNTAGVSCKGCLGVRQIEATDLRFVFTTQSLSNLEAFKHPGRVGGRFAARPSVARGSVSAICLRGTLTLKHPDGRLLDQSPQGRDQLGAPCSLARLFRC